MSAGYNPTVRRRRLGVELRRLREAAALTGEEAAARMRWSGSKLSRIERGQVASNSDDVRDLLDLYGVTDETLRESLVTLARESRRRGWWHVYGDVLPEHFEVYLGLEPEASTLRFYQAQIVPGLLQTESYARELMQAHPLPVDPDEVSRRAELRIRRQELLAREHPPQVWVVLDEAVVQRTPCTGTVLADQLHHLIEMSRKPHITLQLLPFSCGVHSGLNGSFDILEFTESDIHAPKLVHLENLTSSLYIERAHEVRHYTVAFEHLRTAALHPVATREFLAGVEQRIRPAHGGENREGGAG
ncbi:helix-turn-helix transcriptional regulator [Lipingzhangella sp. LS1_29]|uniref:Helix-turn-helix transcriptional regulator n=1 Tax=Lipingzhangella rawalii TaxID=2055835 RepID=A0ABU2H9T8_9ACTN|nr:helix-turn-helix transcriptional regulator [Lipingzhangella rawalii]MDS1272053.1 helix-turn-helix transcriptional regulator [Lipingzhangella rawalii]